MPDQNAQSMAALMADPQARSAERRLPTMNRRMGVVTAVSILPTFPVYADVEVNGQVIPGCSPQSTYRPQVGDLVWLEMLGADPHISPPLTTYDNRKWNNLTLQGAWVQMTGGGWDASVAAYWRDPAGIVRLRGSVKSGAHNSFIATLPAGYRPPVQCGFSVYCYDSGGTAAIGQVAIATTGTLLYLGPTGSAHVALDGVSFRID